MLENIFSLLLEDDPGVLRLVEQTKPAWYSAVRKDSLTLIIRMTLVPVNSMEDLVDIAKAVLARLATRGVYYTDGSWGVIPLESLWDITPLVLHEIVTLSGASYDFPKSKRYPLNPQPLRHIRQEEWPLVPQCNPSIGVHVPSPCGG